MSGPEHYAAAEEILAGVAEFEAQAPEIATPEGASAFHEYVDREIQKAKVHAELAHTAVTAAALLPDSVSWQKALGQ